MKVGMMLPLAATLAVLSAGAAEAARGHAPAGRLEARRKYNTSGVPQVGLSL